MNKEVLLMPKWFLTTFLRTIETIADKIFYVGKYPVEDYLDSVGERRLCHHFLGEIL